ncbi:transcription factor Jun-like [Babylonia areolata]|uniref:transcription factor Jun-like n=1 Tax=Babylonia areolata TaxID=304850 RepID=UPI003FD19136
MEPSMFDSNEPEPAVKRLKRNMTLDFNGSSSKAKKTAALLQSPDLHMLKLASPELEKMIIQANGMVTTTPTPTQFVFPKFVTEEQEAYARGFVDALAQLQSQELGSAKGLTFQPSTQAKTVVTSTANDSDGQSFPPNSTVTQSAALPVVTSLQQVSTTTSLPNGINLTTGAGTAALPVSSAVGVVSESKPAPQPSQQAAPVVDIHIRLPKLEEEPQTVPCLSSSPPLSPINMESQERIKLERKRARNRVAARKCRTRKLERIARLEDRVKDLKGQNNDLLATATSLREQVMKLKQQIVEHVNSGCQIMVTQNMTL